ncbi:MAG: peptidylprolyl isomerase [Clostridiales bacterium]|nr:peptidylprolyl isomerase [Clostridiales bacterium]
MSASDKKKQRKENLGSELTQRQRKEQAEAQAAKRKKTIYIVIGVICAVAAAALLIWNASFWKTGAVAATVDGTEYKACDLQYYYAQARNMEYYYAQYGWSQFNASKSDGAQWYDEAEGKTYADYFRESALESLKQTVAVCKAAEEAGYTLSKNGQETIDNNLAQLDKACVQNNLTRGAYLAQVYGSGVTEKVYLRNLTNDVLASEYEQYYQDSLTYDDAALEDYYKENTDSLDSFDYRIFTVDGTAPAPMDENGNPKTDENGNQVEATDEEKQAAMDAAKEKADAAVAEITASDDKEAAFIAAAPNYVTEDEKSSYSDPDYSLHTAVRGNMLSSSTSTDAADWLKDSARKAGDVTAIESTNGYQVVLFLNRYLVQDPTVDIRHILIKAELADEDDPNTEDVDESKVPTQEALDAAKAKAESILEEWKSGDATAESFGALAEEYSEDPGSNTKGGEYTYVYQGQMFDDFDQWIFDPSRKSGDTGLVENTQDGQQGWHIIYFENTDGPYWKYLAITAKQQADRNEWLTALTDAATAEAADGMKYVGSENTAQPTATPTPNASADPEASESPAE